MLKRGADFQGWAERGHFPEPCPMESNRAGYLDNFATGKDTVHILTKQGEVDRVANIRAVMRRYCKDRGLF